VKKNSPKMWATFVVFESKKSLNVQNSPNLVTLMEDNIKT
jgi:hypothetical protein